jgi:tripartite-type tricarboxylate transporter receptor subunit TctC
MAQNPAKDWVRRALISACTGSCHIRADVTRILYYKHLSGCDPEKGQPTFWEERMIKTISGISRRSALKGGLAAAGSMFAMPVIAQSGWPNRQITWLNPFPAGGGTDAFARPLAAYLDQQLGTRTIIDNRGGAGGTVGASAAAKATPDGYTFFVGAAHHTIAPAIYPSLDYDLETNFVPIGLIARPPQVISVNPQKVKFKTLAEFIADSKANPNKYNYGSSGNGSVHHMAGELFQIATGTKMTHVPYRGVGPAMQDLVAGNIDLMFDGLGSSANQIQAGTLNALAVAAPKRSSAIPNVPTTKEAGLDGYEVSTWYALWAIKGTPQDIVDRMTAELLKALDAPQIKDSWEKNGSEIIKLTGKDFGAYVTAEIARWGKVVKDAGVRL